MNDDFTAPGASRPSAAAGWYADPWGQGALRYWDGAGWTPHTHAPQGPSAGTWTAPGAAPPASPATPPASPATPAAGASTSAAGAVPVATWEAPAVPVATPPVRTPDVNTNTVWIWLIVLLPLVSSVTALLVPWRSLFDYSDILDDPARASTMSLTLFTAPGYWLTLIAGWIVYGFSVWFAYLDRRELLARGIDRPFPWPWAFLNSVYPIGRAVVSIRRTGHGAAPIWVVAIVLLLTFGVAGYVTWTAMDATLGSMSEIFRDAQTYGR